MSKTKVNLFDEALAAEGVTGKLAELARSIYKQESGSGANTKTSNRGAVGGMQILPKTFASVADQGWDINDPLENARAGIRYLAQMDKLSGGVPELTAAGYYGGPGGLAKAKQGVAVYDPVNPQAPNTLQYGQQVAARLSNQNVPTAPSINSSQTVATGNPYASAVAVPPVSGESTPQPTPTNVPPAGDLAAINAPNAWVEFLKTVSPQVAAKPVTPDALDFGAGETPQFRYQPLPNQKVDFRAFGAWGPMRTKA